MQKTLSELGLTELNAPEMKAANGGNTDPLYTIIKQLLSGGGETGTKTSPPMME